MRAARAGCLAATLLAAACGTRTPAFVPTAREATPDGSTTPEARPDAGPVELCNGRDDDGDGTIDEGCACVVGAVERCFDAPPEREGVGPCRAGQRRCEPGAAGVAWGVCAGAVLPEPEVCGDGLDQDCDGGDLACPPVEEHETFVVGEGAVLRPLDVIWVVDQSLSMVQEIANTRANLNRFAETIGAAGVDYRVVLVAERPRLAARPAALCVPPPLAGPDCADAERFLQIDQHVESHDALTLVQEHIEAIEAFMRPGSRRVLVVVSDDDSGLPAADFDAWARARPGYEDYVVDAIVGIDPRVCPAVIGVGTTYLQLAEWTGGEIEHICSPDWSVTFERFAEAIAGLDRIYPLRDVPLPGTLRVSWDGVEQPEGRAWSYDPAANAVELAEAFAPPLRTVIDVTYLSAP